MEKREPLRTVGGYVNWYSQNRKHTEILENKELLQSSYSTSGYFSKENKTHIQKDICTPKFIVALFTISKIRKWPNYSWIDKEDVIYIQWDITQLQKNEILSFVIIWMNLEVIMLSEISQTETNTILFYFYVESKKQSRWTDLKK